MSIKIGLKNNKLTVETDYKNSEVDHSMIHSDSELIGAMKSFGIDKVEGYKNPCSIISSLHEDFDRQFKEKYGSSQGYLRPF